MKRFPSFSLSIICCCLAQISWGQTSGVQTSEGRISRGQTVSHHVMKHGGHEREYWISVPDSLAPGKPLVFLLHGYGGTAEAYFSDMDSCALRHGFVLCRPQGLKDPGNGKTGWNVGYPSQEGWDVDDVDFICRLSDKLVKELDLNPLNVFFTGMSNGGEMCYMMAYLKPGRFGAIASMAGLNMEWLYKRHRLSKPVAFMEIHGTEDSISMWEGDPRNSGGWGEYIAVPVAVGNIVAQNRCTHELCDTLPLYKPGSHAVVRHRYMGGIDGKEVQLLEVIGGEHSRHEGDLDTAETIWAFFEKYLK